MRRPLLLLLNIVGALFSGWWISAHITRTGRQDWEFWFALGYLMLSLINIGHYVRLWRDAV